MVLLVLGVPVAARAQTSLNETLSRTLPGTSCPPSPPR